MKIIAFVTAILVVVLVSSFGVSAQNEALPACSHDDLLKILQAIEEGGLLGEVEKAAALMQEANPLVSDFSPLVEEISRLQETWWSNTATDFPNCAAAYKLKLSLGRFLDELLITASTSQIIAAELEKNHTDNVNRLQERLAYNTRTQDELHYEALALFQEIFVQSVAPSPSPTPGPTVQPTPSPESSPTQSATVTCGDAQKCGDMGSCEQAYACLREGNQRLDSDNDGVPCEAICPGG